MPLSLLFSTFLRIVSGSHGLSALQFQTSSLQADVGGDRKVRRMASSLLLHVWCNYRCVPHGSSVLPNLISGPVESLNLTVPLGVIWGCARIFHATQLVQLPVEVVFKFSPLIMMNP